VSPRRAARVFLFLALLAASCAARAAGGELKPWSGGRRRPRAARPPGQEHKLAEYKGKVVVLNFWATWCDPCREKWPSMQAASGQLAGKPFATSQSITARARRDQRLS